MPIITYKPTSAARRNMSVTDYSSLSKKGPEKSLLASLKHKAGRNSYGRITVRHRGGGNRTKYRIIDFKRQKHDMAATVQTIEYDPNRSAFIALVQYEDGEKRYIIAPHGLKVGDVVYSGANADIKPGNALPLKNIPVGTFVHNVELYAGKIDHENVKIGKAGRKRHMGWRPTVRGSVMNPNDHPHGGGEGKSPIGHPGPVTPWGKPALGYKTRKPHNQSDKFIVRRRNGK